MHLDRTFLTLFLVTGVFQTFPVVAAPTVKTFKNPTSSTAYRNTGPTKVAHTSMPAKSKTTTSGRAMSLKTTPTITSTSNNTGMGGMSKSANSFGRTPSLKTKTATGSTGIGSTSNSANSFEASRMSGLHGNIGKGISSKISSNQTSSSGGGWNSSSSTSDLERRITNLETEINTKQDVLRSGEGIDISGTTIDVSNEIANLPTRTNQISQQIDNLQGALSDGDGGLINVADLQSTVNELEAASQIYYPGDGIKVITSATQGDPAIISLDLPNNPSRGAYVYTIDSYGEGTWQLLEVENSWNPGY